MRRLKLAILAALAAPAALAADLAPAPPRFVLEAFTPQDNGRLTLILENDALSPSPTDRHYTQGARLSYLSPRLEAASSWDGMFGLFSTAGAPVRRIEAIVGQSLFTPRTTQLVPPDPTDRPYAGWLYGGLGLLQEDDGHSLHNLELLAGVVGPSALGRETQTGFHRLLGQTEPLGWGYQLRDEPGFVLSYDRKWRFGAPIGAGLTGQIIPEVGLSVGNVFTHAQAGALLRIGQNLEADYGSPRIRPALSGTTWFDPRRLQGPFGWALFAGVQVRAVAHNIFLDGNTFRDGPSVSKNPLVADVTGGVSVFWSDVVKLDAQVSLRTEEFRTQREPDRYGGLSLSVRLP